MKARLLPLLLLVAYPLVASGQGIFYDSSQKGVTGGGRVDGDLQCVDDIEMVSSCQLTSDAAPSQSVIRTAQDAYPLATVNTSGGDIVLLAGAGTTNVNMDDHTQCGGSTVTVTINGTAHVLTEGVSWTAATSNAATCTSLCAAIDALTGVSCAACSTAKAPVAVDSGAYVVAVSRSAPACATATNGASGQLLFAAGTASKPGLAFRSYTGSGIFDYGGGILGFSVGGTEAFRVSGNAMSVAAAMFLYWSGRSRIYSNTDGYFTLTGSSGSGFTGLRFGGVTASYPMVKVSTTKLQLKLADDSDYAGFDAKTVRLTGVVGASPAEPVACGATTTGTMTYVDDNNDSAAAAVCICIATPDDSTYDWVRMDDTSTACPFF
jgi:hypothetical protein